MKTKHYCIIKCRKFISSYPHLVITVPHLFLLVIKIIMLVWGSRVLVGGSVGSSREAGADPTPLLLLVFCRQGCRYVLNFLLH